MRLWCPGSQRPRLTLPRSRPARHPLRSGANVRARNAEGMTPAQLAESLGDVDIADLLKQQQRLQRLQSHGRQAAGAGSASFRSPMPEGKPPMRALLCCLPAPAATL